MVISRSKTSTTWRKADGKGPSCQKTSTWPLFRAALAPHLRIVAFLVLPMDDAFPPFFTSVFLEVHPAERPRRVQPPEQLQDLPRIVLVADAAHFQPVQIVQKVHGAEVGQPDIAGVAEGLQDARTFLEEVGVKRKGCHRASP